MTYIEYVMSKNSELDKENTIKVDCPDEHAECHLLVCNSNCTECWNKEISEEEM